MKLTLVSLTVAAQLAAAGAMAQTTDGITGTPSADTAAPLSGSFGSDWSVSLGTAMFGESGTGVRPASEIEAQWLTLSEEDRTMLRRDCMVFMQEAGTGMTPDATGSNAAGATADTDATGTGTAGSGMGAMGTDAIGTAGDTPTTGGTGMLNVSAESMEAICAATADL